MQTTNSIKYLITYCKNLPDDSEEELKLLVIANEAQNELDDILSQAESVAKMNLEEEIYKIIKAGNKLAEAAHRLQSEYDGIHRLRIALSEWYKVRASEYGRGNTEVAKGSQHLTDEEFETLSTRITPSLYDVVLDGVDESKTDLFRKLRIIINDIITTRRK